MRVLVMGGSYFIGRHLVQRLADDGHQVRICNRGTKQRDYPSGVSHIVCDRNDHAQFAEIFGVGGRGDRQYDVCLDLSAFRGEQTQALTDLLGDRVGHMIHLSTAAVYSDAITLPLHETALLGGHRVRGAYGDAKLSCERVLHESAVPYTIVRPSYVYGPHNYIERETFLFDRIEQGRPIVIPYDGQAVIQLGHVSDLIDAFCLIMQTPSVMGEIFNVSGDECVTLAGLVNCVGRIMETDVEIVYADPAIYGYTDRDFFPFDNISYWTDTTRIKDSCGWQPQRSLQRGLSDCYERRQRGDYADVYGEQDYSAEDAIVRSV